MSITHATYSRSTSHNSEKHEPKSRLFRDIVEGVGHGTLITTMTLIVAAIVSWAHYVTVF